MTWDTFDRTVDALLTIAVVIFTIAVLAVATHEQWTIGRRRYRRSITEHPTTNVVVHPRAYDWAADTEYSGGISGPPR